jgi:hypothetical protein
VTFLWNTGLGKFAFERESTDACGVVGWRKVAFSVVIRIAQFSVSLLAAL